MTTGRNEHQARKLLALGLDEFGHHTEAANVRAGIDLDDYKVELWAILAALNAKPAAAQEAVAWMTRKALDRFAEHRAGNADAAASSYAYAMPDDDCFVPLYAAPVTAAPARVTVRVAGVGSATLEVVDGCIDLPLDTIMSIAARGTPAAPVAIFQERSTHSVYRGSCGSLPCYCWAENDHIIGDEVKRYSTPAAPGIDLYPIRCALQYAAAAARENTHTEMAEGFDALIRKIDASPKGALNEQFGSAEGLDGPKDGSEARLRTMVVTLAPLWRLSDSWLEASDSPSDKHRAMWGCAKELRDKLVQMQTQAGDAEVQPLCDLCRKRPEAHSDAEGIGFCEVCWGEWVEANSHGAGVSK